MLGRRNPRRFPTLEEFEAAKLRWPTAIWSSFEEAVAAEQQGARYREVLAANRIARAS